jgi:predicted TPR repeat methyltransferase
MPQHRPKPDLPLGPAFAQAMAAWENGNLTEARRLGRRIVERRPDFGGGHYLLGLIAQRQGLTRKAVEFLTQAVAVDPTQPVPRLALGRALESLGDDIGATREYRALLAADPAHAEAHARLGEILARQGRRDEAIAACRAAVAAHPRHAEALCRLGALLHEAGQPDLAAGFLERALALRPDWPTALYDYGLVLVALGRFAPAETILAGAAELRPDHAATATALAGVLRRQGRLDAAQAEAERAAHLAPKDPAVWLELGQARAARHHHEGAAAAFERAVALAPESAEAHWCLAESCRALGQAGRAAEHYRASLSLDPDDRVGAALGLAQLDAAALPERAPEAYVRQLFDDYAPRFDAALVGQLAYCGPQRIGALLDLLWPDARGLAVLDAGCGTGLAGPVLRPRAARLDGIDLSPAMVERAAQRGLYDRLDVGELVGLLADRPGSYDLIAAADVLVYFGDLAPLLGAITAALRPGGLFVATLERAEGEGGYRLGRGNRYAHGAPYLAAAAAAAGLAPLCLDPTVTRREAGADVPGWAWALRRA